MIASHPSALQLELLAQGKLAEPEAAQVRSHLDGCVACQERYNQCRADEKLADDLRDAMQGSTHVADQQDSGSVEVTTTAPLTGEDIEGYRLIREIHRGGQGVVYQAIQKSTKQRVAIKVMHEGRFAGADDTARFEREVAILGQLRHPNIIAIHDSGTAAGCFYYVMDYVSGRSLDEYVSAVKPPITETLELFAKICDAVNAAHLRGIIHRDLKPGNVRIDEEGEPHILDFGLAKVATGHVSQDTRPQLMTMTGQFFGSLPWASPEQAEAIPSKIDLRTDVYSLGVILYQMLTERFPYEVVGSVRDVMENILSTEPARPSTIRRQINDEIETIALKALSKDRERRYQTAGELARDVRHYLKGEPIEAKRDSSWYLLKKTVARHKVPVGVVATFVVLLAAFGVTVAVLRARAERNRRLVEAQAVRVDRARAADIMVTFVHDPPRAVADTAHASPRVKEFLAEETARYVASRAFTQRIVGARGALWTNPESFWASVDGGPLWRYGEWLELAVIDWPDPKPLLGRLVARAETGSDRQKYVALNLIGQIAPRDPALADRCVAAVRTATHPGVISAARWAAMRLGRNEPHRPCDAIQVDVVSGLTFAKLPGCDAFRRGSPPHEKDRSENEAMPSRGVPIAPFYLATTEMTVGAFAPFMDDPEVRGWLASLSQTHAELRPLITMSTEALRDQISRNALDEVVGRVSLEMARRYCGWLTARASGTSPRRRYRLPTEDEWEYACRGDNAGRFCFGDNADYARFYAECQGYRSGTPVVAQRMPNAYGLFDMHGGLWEWCDSRFPPELVTDPRVTAVQKESLYVLRGGAYYSPAVRCRSAQRNYSDVHTPGMYWGFRVVMETIEQ